MEAILFGETEIEELKVSNDTLMLTDKRFIFNESFIGINQLRSAQSNLKTVKIDNTENITSNGVTYFIGVVIFIVAFVWLYFGTHPYNFISYLITGFFAWFFAFCSSLLVTIPVMILLRIVGFATTKTVNVTEFKVIKTDGSVYLMMNYSEEDFDRLNAFCNQLNSIIYK